MLELTCAAAPNVSICACACSVFSPTDSGVAADAVPNNKLLKFAKGINAVLKVVESALEIAADAAFETEFSFCRAGVGDV